MRQISFFGEINFDAGYRSGKPSALVVRRMRQISVFSAINFCYPINGPKCTFVVDRISGSFRSPGLLVAILCRPYSPPSPYLFFGLMLLVLFVLGVTLNGGMER